MTDITEHNPHPENTEFNSDEAATIFARLFLELHQYNMQTRKKQMSDEL